MGVYTYFSDTKISNMKSVTDTELNELLQEVLEIDNSILIEEHRYEQNTWFTRKYVMRYTVYYEQRDKDGVFLNEARQQISAGSDKKTVSAYFYGIINGYLKSKKP